MYSLPRTATAPFCPSEVKATKIAAWTLFVAITAANLWLLKDLVL